MFGHISQPLQQYGNCYDGLIAYNIAAKQANSIDPDKVRAALENLKVPNPSPLIVFPKGFGWTAQSHVMVSFDTFYDRRSGFAFYTNPLGARADYSVVDEGASNTDWNPVWTSKTGRFDGGWTVEMAIPLKSIRYRPGPNQTLPTFAPGPRPEA